jgi:hypothetical protein
MRFSLEHVGTDFLLPRKKSALLRGEPGLNIVLDREKRFDTMLSLSFVALLAKVNMKF